MYESWNSVTPLNTILNLVPFLHVLLEVAGVGGVVGALGALQLEGDLVHGADVVVHALLLARPVVAERALVVTHLQNIIQQSVNSELLIIFSFTPLQKQK